MPSARIPHHSDCATVDDCWVHLHCGGLFDALDKLSIVRAAPNRQLHPAILGWNKYYSYRFYIPRARRKRDSRTLNRCFGETQLVLRRTCMIQEKFLVTEKNVQTTDWCWRCSRHRLVYYMDHFFLDPIIPSTGQICVCYAYATEGAASLVALSRMLMNESTSLTFRAPIVSHPVARGQKTDEWAKMLASENKLVPCLVPKKDERHENRDRCNRTSAGRVVFEGASS